MHSLLGPATVALAVPLYANLDVLRRNLAMGIAEKLGGLPSLTAVLVVATGILGRCSRARSSSC